MSKVCPYQSHEYIGYDEIKVESCPIQEHITEECEICCYTNDYNECPIYVLQSQLQQKENIIKDIKAQLDYLETYSSKEDVYEDMSRRLNNIEKIIDKENK